MSVVFERVLTASRRAGAPAAACLAALVLLPLGAWAQPAPAAKPAASTPAPKAAASTPAPAQPSASHLAAARELVIASGMTRSFNAAIPQLVNQLVATYGQTRPDLTPDLHAVLIQLEPEFQKQTGELVDKAAHIVARQLSEPDIKAAVAFFDSGAGKDYVQAQPYFFDDIVNAMQDWHQRVEAQLITRVREELKKKGHKL
jgi:hypothetical protein